MLASRGSLVGTLQAGISQRGSLTSYLQSSNKGSLLGTLSRLRIESWDGDAESITCYGFRVELGGVDVTDDVVADVQILSELDRHDQAELTLFGTKYSFLVTQTTWTQTLLEIWFQQGKPGFVQEEKRFSGFVFSGSDSGNRSYRINAFDRGAFYGRNTVCLEIGPEQGSTRGAILRSMALTAGYGVADIPDGKVYNKPVSSTSEFWPFAVSFIEPQKWHLRTAIDGTLETYEIILKETPDHIWHVDDLITRPKIKPPDQVPSRWVFRGTSTRVTTESDGIVTETISFPIYGFYNPETTHTQDTSGVITERSFSPGVHSNFTQFRLIKLVESATRKIGNVLLSKVDSEKTWVNPASAQYVTAAAGGGPQNSNFVQCFILDGKALTWSSARFMESLRREEYYSYDEEGTEIGSIIYSFEFFRKTQGVETPGDPGSKILGVPVGDDNQSYARNGGGLYQIEGFGLASQYNLTRTYDADKGVESEEVQDTLGWYSVRTHTGTTGGYLLFNGESQKDSIAIFQLVEDSVKTSLVNASLQKLGEIESLMEWDVTQSSIGQYDYGNFTAEAPEEVFRTTEIKATAYDVLSPGFFQSVVWSNGRRATQVVLGKPPMPRFVQSEWTRYASDPMEVVVDDGVVEDWFSREISVVQVEHAIDEQELESIMQRRRSRELSFQVEVDRHETVAKIGDTVMLIDPWQGLAHSGILISYRTVRSATLSRTAYIVEIPMFQLDSRF